MDETRRVRVGIVGVGGMGSAHAHILSDFPGVELVAVCDIKRDRADQIAAKYGVKAYYSHAAMLNEANLEAIVIATPHYDHTTISIDAFAKGLHVMCEKPLAVHVNDGERSIAAYEEARRAKPDLVFGIMFQERTVAFYKKMKELIGNGDLGKLVRATWINTTWFRTQAYYDSGDWRATWSGEGGGILSNQCPHNLDMYQWLFGMPSRITGRISIGKYHKIEVEDEAASIFEHADGMVGHFMVTTGECPGSNRLEIAGENGKLVYEDDKLVFTKNSESMMKFCAESPSGFGRVPSECIEVEVPREDAGHHIVHRRFYDAIIGGEDSGLVAHGTEGIRGVTLANGIMLSAFTERTVDVPIDADAYEAKLRELIAQSQHGVKQTGSEKVLDLTESWDHMRKATEKL